jgi:rod shape-determining protein MreC
MYHILEFLRKYYYILIFIVLEIISFWALFRFNNYQGSVWLTSANSTTAKINRLYYDIATYWHLGEVNRKLTSENLRLQQEAHALREALLDQKVEGTFLDSITRTSISGYQYIDAKVIVNSDRKKNNYIVIDKGANDGITRDMGVICGNGVVGIVCITGPRYSLVTPIINKHSNISCRIRGERHFGTLQWDGKDCRYVYLDEIPRYAKIKKGSIIETSGHSSVFPPGLYVGKVNSVNDSPDGQSFRLKVELGTDFLTTRDVNIVVTPYKAEIDTLQLYANRAYTDEPS